MSDPDPDINEGESEENTEPNEEVSDEDLEPDDSEKSEDEDEIGFDDDIENPGDVEGDLGEDFDSEDDPDDPENEEDDDEESGEDEDDDFDEEGADQPFFFEPTVRFRAQECGFFITKSPPANTFQKPFFDISSIRYGKAEIQGQALVRKLLEKPARGLWKADSCHGGHDFQGLSEAYLEGR